MRIAVVMPLAFVALVLARVPGWGDDRMELTRLIDRSVKALGGAKKLAKLKGATWKGKGHLANPSGRTPFTEESVTNLPEQFYMTMETMENQQQGRLVIVVNRDKGWIKAGEQTSDMPKDFLAAFKNMLYARSLALHPQGLLHQDITLSPLGEIRIGDKPAQGVRTERKGFPAVNVYFDKETGLPVKTEMNSRELEDNREVTFEFFFSDYKEFNGVKACSKLVWKKNGQVYLEREIADVTPREKPDDSVFGRP
jgi:hypothetical protein